MMTIPMIRIQDAGDSRDLGWLRADQFVQIDAGGQYAKWPALNTSRFPLGDVMVHRDDRAKLLAWVAQSSVG